MSTSHLTSRLDRSITITSTPDVWSYEVGVLFCLCVYPAPQNNRRHYNDVKHVRSNLHNSRGAFFAGGVEISGASRTRIDDNTRFMARFLLAR